MRALLYATPLLLACSGPSSSGKPDTTPKGQVVTGEGTRGFDEYPEDYGADEYGDFYGYDYDEGYSEPPYEPPPPTPPSLVGTWVGACEAGAKDSRRLTYVFTDVRWDLDTETFADTTCTKRASLLEVGGPYTFGAQSTTVTSAWDAVMAYDRRDLTIDDKKAAKKIAKDCKLGKVDAGKPVSLLDAGCAKLGIAPVADCPGEFDIVSVDGLTLQLGVRPADGRICTEDKRPTALDASHGLTFEIPKSGIPECDALFATAFSLVNCAALPAEVRSSMTAAVNDMLAIYKDAETCKTVHPQLQDAAKSMGC